MFTLALGIGATSAVFSLIQGVLLTPPPYRQPDRLVLIPSARADGQKLATPRGWAAAQWMEWQKEAKSLDGIAAYVGYHALVETGAQRDVVAAAVDPEFFRVLGVNAASGKLSYYSAEVTNQNGDVVGLFRGTAFKTAKEHVVTSD